MLPELGGSDANERDDACGPHGSTCVRCISHLHTRRWPLLLVLFTAPSHCFDPV